MAVAVAVAVVAVFGQGGATKKTALYSYTASTALRTGSLSTRILLSPQVQLVGIERALLVETNAAALALLLLPHGRHVVWSLRVHRHGVGVSANHRNHKGIG